MKRWLSGALALGIGSMVSLQAQTAAPVAAFNLKQFSGVWHEVLRSPQKDSLKCMSEPTVLYSLTEKPGRFAGVRSCNTKGNFLDARNTSGRLAAKDGTGALKVRTIWPFWRKYDVVALGPDDAWAVLASSKRKMFWVLTRELTPDADTMIMLRQKVGQLGFDATRLIAYPAPL